jgi:hypothetical protein
MGEMRDTERIAGLRKGRYFLGGGGGGVGNLAPKPPVDMTWEIVLILII